MKLGTSAAVALAAVLLAAVVGCERQEGPAERAGKALDRSMEKAGQKLEKAGDGLQDAAKGDK